MSKNDEKVPVLINPSMADLLRHSQTVNGNIAEANYEMEKKEAIEKFGLHNQKEQVDGELQTDKPDAGNDGQQGGSGSEGTESGTGEGSQDAGTGTEEVATGDEGTGAETGEVILPAGTDTVAPVAPGKKVRGQAAAPAADVGDKKPWDQ